MIILYIAKKINVKVLDAIQINREDSIDRVTHLYLLFLK